MGVPGVCEACGAIRGENVMASENIKLFHSLNDILAMIPIPIFEQLSYESKLGKSLKKTLRHFDSLKLLEEVETVAEWLNTMNDILRGTKAEYRIKSLESIRAKYERLKSIQGCQVCEVFNDILGLRFVCGNYEELRLMKAASFRISDMSKGKANDDGYRGLHVYYQMSNKHYPIELQFHTLKDSRINAFLHDNVYKRGLSSNTGRQIRAKYEENLLKGEDGFKDINIALPENNMHTSDGEIITP